MRQVFSALLTLIALALIILPGGCGIFMLFDAARQNLRDFYSFLPLVLLFSGVPIAIGFVIGYFARRLRAPSSASEPPPPAGGRPARQDGGPDAPAP
jgi:hypothetical protein